MGNGLAEIIKQLQNPDASSSLIPLVVIMGLLLVGTIVVLAKVISILRSKLPTKTADATPTNPFRTVISNAGGKLREILSLIPVVNLATKPTASTELDQLREMVRKLEQANAVERDMHARSLRKLGELQSELETLAVARSEETKLLDIERQRRWKLEAKVEHLEGQLRDAIRETERIYHQNAAVAEAASEQKTEKRTPSVTEILKDFPPPEEAPAIENATPEVVAKQAAEIQKLKQILQSCKVELLDKNNR